MTNKEIRIVDDGSRYTVCLNKRLPSGRYEGMKIVAEHLDKATAINLTNSYKSGISGFYKEVSNDK